jgi:peptidoglycan/LPS O-acetylase OafA/YrhL
MNKTVSMELTLQKMPITQDVNFNLQKTYIAKGIAICLMFVHHLFVFKERLINGNTYYQVLPFFDAEVRLGYFGKICVSVFLFLSGYGMFLGYFRSQKSPISYALRKLKEFYLTYWVYFLCFVPIGILFFKNVTLWDSSEIRYSTEPLIFLANFLGLSSRYNQEWWFVSVFIILLLVSPIYLKLTEKSPFLLAFISLFGFSLNHELDRYIDYQVFFWQISFALGMLCAKGNFFESTLIERFDKSAAMSLTAILVLTFLMHRQFDSLKVNYDFLLTPFFVYASVQLAVRLNLSKIFACLGKYSFPLWLTHSFFCYYYFQDFVYSLKWSPLVFIVLTSLSLISVVGIENTRSWVMQVGRSMKSSN